MNTVDLLMKLDAGKVTECPTKTIEIKRLSKIAGEPFIVEVGAVNGRRYAELLSMTQKGNKVDISKSFDANLMTAVEGIRNIDLKNKELQAHYSASTPKDLVEKLFTPGEIVMIADLVGELNGYGDERDVEKEVRD